MVFRRHHWQLSDDCKEVECKPLTAYVRIDGKWTSIGYFGSACKKFEPFDIEEEEQNIFNSEMNQIKQEDKDRLKIIKSELNINKSFFEQ